MNDTCEALAFIQKKCYLQFRKNYLSSIVTTSKRHVGKVPAIQKLITIPDFSTKLHSWIVLIELIPNFVCILH